MVALLSDIESLELELQRQLRRASGLAILAAERAVRTVREIRTADLIISAQVLLQRGAVGDVQETESDLEPAVAEREPPSDSRVPLRQGWSLKLPLAASAVRETHGRRQRIRDGSPIGQHQCRRTELRVRRCQEADDRSGVRSREDEQIAGEREPPRRVDRRARSAASSSLVMRYRSFAASACACFKSGTSVSACFHRVRKSW